MSVTGVAGPSRDAVLAQVDRLVNADILKGSESLCRLLRYLAQQALQRPGIPIKEYQIATEVFGRAADFDPRLDSTVRVQTGRLRAKLAEYYSGPGAADSVLVDLPKGSYSLSVHDRAPTEVAPGPPPAAPEPPSPPVVRQPFRPAVLVASIWALGIAVAVLIATLAVVVLNRPAVALPSVEPTPAALRTFWHGFIDQHERPLVMFSDAAFVGRPEIGMRYFDPRRDSGTPILDHYTGVGEVLAIHELDRLFASMQGEIRVKRGRLLSLDDARNNDLVFIGSPSENLSLREVPNTQDFVFRLADSGPRKGDLAIRNLNPRPGEADAYWGSPALPISEDHSLIAVLPGIASNRWVMVLAGTTTIGTEAAAEFVARARSVEELITRAGVVDGGIHPFEAVIRVKVTGGVPVSSEIVALHPRN